MRNSLKRLLTILLVLTLVLPATMPAMTVRADEAAGTIVTATDPDDEGKVTVTITENDDVTNGRYTVNYDANVLTYESTTMTAGFQSINDKESGTIEIAYAQKEAISAGDVVATIVFTVGTEDTTVTVKTTERGDTLSLIEENKVTIEGRNKISDYTATLIGVSVTLKGKLSVNFYLQSDEAAYAVLTYQKDGSEVRYDINKDTEYYDEKYDRYKLSFSEIAAKEMNLKVELQVFDGNNNVMELVKAGENLGSEYYYSVEDWVDTILKTSSSQKVLDVAYALINYGNYAQHYFDYNAGDLSYTESYLADQMDAIEADSSYNAIIPEIASENGYLGASLVLRSDTTIRLYFDREVKVFDESGIEYDLHEASGRYYIETEGIPAKNLDDFFTFVVNNDGVEFTIQYSALSYANVGLSGNSSKTINICKALYLYNDAAKKYFNKS